MSETTQAPRATTGMAMNPQRAHIARVARRLGDSTFGAGPLASLRRGDPTVVMRQPTWHRLMVPVDDAELLGDGALRWATVVHAMAIGARPGTPPPSGTSGRALGLARFTESRLARLLASRDEAFRDQVLLLSRFMHSRDTALAWPDLGELVLTEGRRERRAEQLRLRIARDYYRALDSLPTA